MVYKIAIIGAGPAGCMLARLLLQVDQGITVTIFESEAHLDFRSQGGTLDLHVKTGQAALRAAGLFDEFLKYARYDGEAMKFADKNLLCYVKTSGGKPGSKGTGRPEIDRPQLREMLYNSLPAGTVRWSKKLTHIDADNHKLHFADGTISQGFDLIVGADGGWSKVRPVLTDVKPFYSGIAGHALRIPSAQETHPELYDLVNRGSLFAWSDGKSVMAQYMSDGTLNVSTWSVRPAAWQTTCGYDVHDPKAVKAAYRSEFADWDARLLAFTQVAAEDEVTPRDLYMLPIGTTWPHKAGFTLIGDAAHIMTPFAGEGVNLALEDSLKLSQAILAAATAPPHQEDQKGTSQLEPHIREFEQDMFARARKTGQTTYDMMTYMYLTPGAPRSSVEKFLLRAMEDEVGKVWTLILTPVVYLWFFVFKLIW